MAGIELMLLHRTAIEENHQELLDYLFNRYDMEKDITGIWSL